MLGLSIARKKERKKEKKKTLVHLLSRDKKSEGIKRVLYCNLHVQFLYIVKSMFGFLALPFFTKAKNIYMHSL